MKLIALPLLTGIAALVLLPTAAIRYLGPRASGDRVAMVATLPSMPLGDVSNQAVPGSVPDDHGLPLGSIGSDLWRAPQDPAGQFWMVTDRGPNGEVKRDGKKRRTFPTPGFTPLILRVTLTDGAVSPQEIIPIVGQSGQPVTGLPNLEWHDPQPYDYRGKDKLAFNPSGLDTEGLVRASNGEFWVADEYAPSLVRVAANGVVLKRYVPEGVGLIGADYPVVQALPGIYVNRKENRGFEGLALSPDERTLFLALQSPLSNPDKETGEASCTTRILVFDIATESVTAEYLYEFEPAAKFAEGAVPDDMKLSGLAALSSTSLLALERTDWAARVYRVDLANTPSVLHGPADDEHFAPSVEALADPAAEGFPMLPKTLVTDLTEVGILPGTIEGLAVVDGHTLAVANDDNFDLGDMDSGRNVGHGATSQIALIDLATPLTGS